MLDLERVCAETEVRRREVGEALERFAHNTIEHMREERELLRGRIQLPRFPTDFRDRSTLWWCAASATSATCGPCGRSSATCAR